jgi:colanic acid biosynthesis glycosyl transferase WcaI
MPISVHNRKKILVYGINYSPEPVGIGKYTGELAKWLAREGFDVRVVTAPSYFPEWRAAKNYYQCTQDAGVTVIRCPLWVPRRPNGLTRLLHLTSFAISSLPIILWQARWKPDVIFTIAPAFFCAPASLFLQRLCGGKKQAQAYLHIQDFELDAAFELGILKGPMIRRAAEAWERSILMNFDYVSTISQAMRQRTIKKGVIKQRALLIPNWVDSSVIYPQTESQRRQNPYRAELGIKTDQIVVLYSGSMNKKQGLDTVAEAIWKLKDYKSYCWIIAGEGPSKQDFAEKVNGMPNVKLLSLQPEERMNDWLNLADIHLMPQKKGAADLVLPSKLIGIMASGRPVVASSPPETELANLVQNAGIRVDPDDSWQLAEAIVKLASDKELAQRCGIAARLAALNHFNQDKVLSELATRLMTSKS